jgi:hypothetical protein
VTGYRLRAAERLGLDADAAVALNQLAIQALGQDATPRAREAFAEARDRAVAAGAPAVAAVADRNLEIVDGFLGPPPKDEPPPDEPPSGDDGRVTTSTKPGLGRPLLLLGLGGLIAALRSSTSSSSIGRRWRSSRPRTCSRSPLWMLTVRRSHSR